jgi:hypothetical protein
MEHNEEKRQQLIGELLEYFDNQEFKTLSVHNSNQYPEPERLHNDGYGDQEDKRPDILAVDKKNQCYVVGLARTGDDFETEGSLTEYNVFLDQSDPRLGTQYRLYIIAPANTISQLSSLITHYIHREYWHRIAFVASRRFED